MSSIYTERIKQVKRKEGNSFSSSIPIGTQGLFVDMISTLDLEEQIRLGGNHYIDIIDTDTDTEIRQWYFSQARGSRTLAEMSNLVTFSTIVRITNAVENYIVDRDDKDYLISADNFGYLVERIPLPSDQQRIEMELYRYDMTSENGVLLHRKVIFINELNGQYAIDEQIVTSAEQQGNINNLLDNINENNNEGIETENENVEEGGNE